MNTTKLQIPLSETLRDDATRMAEKQGYSSLQEVVRLFLASYAAGKVRSDFVTTPDEPISLAAEKRLWQRKEELEAEIARGRAFIARDGDDLLDQLKHG
jgi:hypothetical protein